MANINKSYINNLQGKTLQDKVKSEISGIDFNYTGYNRDNLEDSFVKAGTKAHINRCLFWLCSKTNDFVREPLKGGILYDLLGLLNQDTNLRYWEDEIKNRFNSEFANDLTLITISLSMDTLYRKLTIKMLVQDNLDGTLFPIEQEVSR